MTDTLTHTLLFLVWIGTIGYLLFRRLNPLALPKKRMQSADIRAEFRRRRRAAFWYVVVMMASWLTMILSYFVFTRPLPGVLGSTFFAVAVAMAGLVAFVVGNVCFWARYRCPACEESLATEGWVLSQTSCPHCGVDLV